MFSGLINLYDIDTDREKLYTVYFSVISTRIHHVHYRICVSGLRHDWSVIILQNNIECIVTLLVCFCVLSFSCFFHSGD